MPIDEADKVYEVVIGPSAMAAVKELKRYIADDLGSPQAAQRTVESIFDAAESLSVLPGRHRSLGIDPVTGLEARGLVAGNYVLIYVVADGKVFIAAVLYGTADMLGRIRSLLGRGLEVGR